MKKELPVSRLPAVRPSIVSCADCIGAVGIKRTDDAAADDTPITKATANPSHTAVSGIQRKLLVVADRLLGPARRSDFVMTGIKREQLRYVVDFLARLLDTFFHATIRFWLRPCAGAFDAVSLGFDRRERGPCCRLAEGIRFRSDGER